MEMCDTCSITDLQVGGGLLISVIASANGCVTIASYIVLQLQGSYLMLQLHDRHAGGGGGEHEQ